IAHVACRTGYPDPIVAEKLTRCVLCGVDNSPEAIETARAKATLFAAGPQSSGAGQASEVQATYLVHEGLPTPLADQSFTHAYSVHAIADAEGRAALLGELRRILVPGGQALLALPLRGSFPEINDMVREFALRQDLPELGAAIDAAAA